VSELDRYRIDGELGRGAMGIVYRAWDLTLEREVALKELAIPAGMSASTQSKMVERFFREARSAARLTHPNVVQTYDVFRDGDRYFIAMEMLSGVPLGALMDRGRMPVATVAQIMLQVLAGVEAAHAAGIVHRDLKPDNIYVLDDGRVKVTDFGIAKAMGGVGTGTMTQVGTVIGTPGYMAPEQVRGEAIDGRADIFALGVLYYEMLSGANPFLSDSPTTILYRIVHEDPPPLPVTVGTDSGTLGAIAEKALAKDPADRYQTAGEMASDIASRAMPAQQRHSGAAALGTSTRSPSNSGNRLVIAIAVALAIVAAAILGFAMIGSGGPVGGSAGSMAAAGGSPAPTPNATAQAPITPAVPDTAPDNPPDAPNDVAVPPYWGVFFGAFDTQAEADALAQKAMSKGLTVHVLDTRDYWSLGSAANESHNKYCFNVFAGPFPSKSAAQSGSADVKNAGFKGAYVKQNRG